MKKVITKLDSFEKGYGHILIKLLHGTKKDRNHQVYVEVNGKAVQFPVYLLARFLKQVEKSK